MNEPGRIVNLKTALQCNSIFTSQQHKRYLKNKKRKEAREEFIKNNPIVPMNPKQRKYMELLEDKKCIIACGLAGPAGPTSRAFARVGQDSAPIAASRNVPSSRSQSRSLAESSARARQPCSP